VHGLGAAAGAHLERDDEQCVAQQQWRHEPARRAGVADQPERHGEGEDHELEAQDAVQGGDREVAPIAQGDEPRPGRRRGHRRDVRQARDERTGDEERGGVAEHQRHVALARVGVQGEPGQQRADGDAHVRHRPHVRAHRDAPVGRADGSDQRGAHRRVTALADRGEARDHEEGGEAVDEHEQRDGHRLDGEQREGHLARADAIGHVPERHAGNHAEEAGDG
jgi:hypothetical protein